MKKVLGLVLAFVLAFTLVACGEKTTAGCEVDANGICVFEDGTIEWEKNTDGTLKKVTVGVDVQALVTAVETAWNTAYPAYTGLVDAVFYEASDGESSGVTGVVTMKESAPDIMIIIGSGSVGREVNFLDISDYLADVIENDVLQSALNAVNSGDKVHYLPTVYDGMAFAWNKTMLEYLISTKQLSITLADANNDNLPDAFDTWEEIFAIADGLTERMTFKYTKDGDAAETTQVINEFYPLVLGQEWGNYSAYTAGGWQLFSAGNYAQPGFDSDEFLAGLNFIKAYSTHKMSFQADGVTPLASAGFEWRFDNFLSNQYPFGLVGTWMDVDTAENTYNSDFVFSAMPKYNNVQLTPLVKTKGFAVNAYSDVPGAAVKVLQYIFSANGMTVISENSSYLLSLESGSDLIPTTLSTNKVQFAKALGTGFNEPAAKLPLGTVLAVNVLYNSGITAAQREVYDDTKTPVQAQAAIVAAANTWIADNNKPAA